MLGHFIDYNKTKSKLDRMRTFLTKLSAAGETSVYNLDYHLHINPSQLKMKNQTRLWDNIKLHRGLGGAMAQWLALSP